MCGNFWDTVCVCVCVKQYIGHWGVKIHLKEKKKKKKEYAVTDDITVWQLCLLVLKFDFPDNADDSK